MVILITGGAGYIGSHAVVEFLLAGHDVVVLDNLCNSSQISIERIKKITGIMPKFLVGDIRDHQLLDQIFSRYAIDAVVHFAGLKAVGESVKDPLNYFENNVNGSITLLQAMKKANVFNLVFSSSATVYGEPKNMPISEECPTGVPTNPYGRSKLMVEQILKDTAASDPRWSVALLRYFNPIGAHSSGFIGEDPNGPPNNLLPYISQVAIGKLQELSVYGDDYPTKDGTGIRDYIHVVDLAKGHVAALKYITSRSDIHVWNLGTGVGYSVLEMIKAFEHNSGIKIPYRIVQRRLGDIAECWSNPSKALNDLNWKAELGLSEMIKDTWNWQSNNPNGYQD
ncbi:UDP-glucose 4-epimerase GalE [Aquirhabdus parva]|uniref:UDP-glucose 4-epimerase n=1 Tax=Aquirhabdus parva TaxID=2283318 RepID=A0A345PAF9_9GAMM|nr:UDP-glucose 4-epimerase GalE [Aquirhabdus parva]AXI04268.1 UDP-glucose 4-epimerase GalE [Aquirhabdus parva]